MTKYNHFEILPLYSGTLLHSIVLSLFRFLELQKVVMAGHDNLNGSTDKSSSGMDDLPTFNAENMQNNMKVILYSRTFMAIIGGVIAGILGLTSLAGFIFYFLVMAITSAALMTNAKFSIHSYFDSWNRIVLDGFFGGLMSFVLFWTFVYDIVHIF
ncbi:ER membrane protein complex subunit 6 isoform X2 [Capsicum galapagoense]